MKKLKTKILLGLVFLLTVILLLSLTGIISIYYLSRDSDAIIRDNYKSVEYSTNMLDALENIFNNQIILMVSETRDSNEIDYLKETIVQKKEIFTKYLELQKSNITEVHEDSLVKTIIDSYARFNSLIDSSSLTNNYDDYLMNELKARYWIASASIRGIYTLNMSAIYRKNSTANNTANNVTLYMTVAAISSIVLTLIFIFYFPSYVTNPISELTKKIEDISNRKYDQRIDIQSNDELKTLAAAFNKMALSLKAYEAQHIDELLIEKRRMETLVTNLQDGTLLLDKDFNVLLANDKFCSLTGLKKSELLGQNINEIQTDNWILEQFHLTGLKNIQALIKENIKPISIKVDDEIEYYQILFLDIRKQFKTELLSESAGYILLLKNITKYEKRDLAKTNLIATISHELKTPLSSINLSIKLLEDNRIGDLNKEQLELLGSIKLHSSRILNLVNEVLDFAQVETGYIRLKIKSANITDIVELSTFAVLMMLNEKEINLELMISENLSKVKCDLEKTVWIVVNLLSNAIRYSSKKGTISIEATQEKQFIRISVKDNGPGISVQEQNRIFEKYVKSKTEPAKGTGLGLAIAKEFVEVQGGIIGVKSKPGEG
ncbi:MAG TPA: ATP-binding protein, partial [Ignavibacteriaceae bacterium]